MNISITNVCNRHCSYCFQQGWYIHNNHQSTIKREMDPDVFKDIIEWSGLSSISVMGGEPFLHTHISDIFEICDQKLQNVQWISNLSINPQIIEHLDFNSKHSCLANIDYDNQLHEKYFRKNVESLQNKAVHICLSSTITPQTDVDDLLKKISDITKDTVVNAIRLSTLCPIPQTRFMQYDYSEKLKRLCIALREQNLNVATDCPIPSYEMNSDTRRLLAMNGVNIRTKSCMFNPPLDVLVDGSIVWCCSCKNVSTHYKQHVHLSDAKQLLKNKMTDYMNMTKDDMFECLCFAKYKHLGKL